MIRHSDMLQTVNVCLDDLAEQGAYPMVQPMKAALYFESVKGFGQWRILISSRADKMLRKARRSDAKFFKIIVKKIKELSNGHFSSDNQKRLNNSSIDIPIYEAKMTRDVRLVYQIDCAPEYDNDCETQVIKIYGIYTHAQLDGRFWDSVSRQLTRHGKEYTKRCNQRNRSHQAGLEVVLPCLFPPREESVLADIPYDFLELPAEVWDDIHSLLHLDKYVALSQALLFSMLADLDVQHVFSVSLREKEIIEHPYSCYVLGRSGTGKTTTMLFKMLGIERAWETRAEGVPKVRQLFVTKSRILAEKVEEYFAKLTASLSTARKSPEELKELANAQRLAQARDAMVDKDEEVNYQNNLPARFSLLTEDHFPLFITFDHLCKLIEADLTEDVERTYRSKKFISAQTFLHSYWPHFPQTKGLDSSMVFSEFIGVIKGSEEALAYKDGFLDQRGYENLSSRTQPAFAHQRALLYKNFEAYLKLKKERGGYDSADRTRALIQSLQSRGIPGKEVDYLYVDEAQDNLLIDAMILRVLCKNPHGLFWAGDTAQTISVGSSFRFDDLKAFLFRIEHKRQGKTVNLGATRQTTEGPRMFQLAVNYRSHGGIVNCAHSVIELITQFWPYTIDVLGREQGIVDGLKPIFLSARDQDAAAYKRFLFGDKKDHIEFGANQCIIVRDDVARNELREQVGDVGIIMTPYESKGLEFNDVLLYNFFQDSTMDPSQWRVVLNALEPSQRSEIRVPCFDETRHAGLCSELKILYVSITRARRNVWIVDDSETSEPMRVFWTSRDLVMTYTAGTGGPSLAVSSSREEWEDTARSFFKKKRYSHAVQCFEKASLFSEAAVAKAYLLREEAQAVPSGEYDNSVLRTQAFTAAAEAFIRSAVSATLEKATYYRIAAECYKDCDKSPQAARFYVEAGEFDVAAQLYRDTAMFSHAIRVIREYECKMQRDVVDRILFACRLYYFQNLELTQARSLFSSDEEALEFTDTHDFDEAHVALLIKIGKRIEAAEFLLIKGRIFEAHEVLVQDSENEVSVHRVTQYILSSLWEHLSLGLVPIRTKTRRAVDELLRLVTLLNGAMLSSNDRDEISMFQAIVSMDLSRLLQLGRNFCLERTNPAAAILCLDHVFSVSHQATSLTGKQATSNLPAFFNYARLLKKMALSPDASKDLAIQKLLGIQPSSNGGFLIPTRTELHTLLKGSQIRLQVTDKGMVVPGQKLPEAIKVSLRERLGRTLSLVGVVERIKDWPLSANVLFIRQVIHDKLPIDTTALCDVLEYTCGSLVVSMNYRTLETKSLPHRVVLPRSWLQILWPYFKESGIVDMPLFGVLVEPFADLLQQVYLQPTAVRNRSIILSRICRCLCLLGYNALMSGLRLEILRVMVSLPKNLSHWHNLSRYLNARNWNDLVIAVHKSTLGFPADKLVELYLESEISTPQMPGLNVERVTYKDIHDIPRLLGDSSPSESREPSAVQLAECLMVGENPSHDHNSNNVGNAEDYLGDRDTFEDQFGATRLRDLHTTEAGARSTDKGSDQDFVPSENHKNAARVLLRAYRRCVSRRRGVIKPQSSAELARYFTLCLKEEHTKWPLGHIYRKVYLGALPHILLCLEEVHSIKYSEKTEAKERMKVAKHLELEQLGKRQTELAQLLKKTTRLRKTLEPKSKVHLHCDVSLLKAPALEVQALFLQLPPDNVKALEGELAIALRGIVTASGYMPKDK